MLFSCTLVSKSEKILNLAESLLEMKVELWWSIAFCRIEMERLVWLGLFVIWD